MDEADALNAVVQDFLEEVGDAYFTSSDGSVFATLVSGTARDLVVTVHPSRSENMLHFRVPLLCADERRRVEVAEAVARANDLHVLGLFSINMSDGRVEYRASLPIGEGQPSFGQFTQVLDLTCAICRTYDRAFLRLVFSDDLSPAEVIAEVEMAERVD